MKDRKLAAIVFTDIVGYTKRMEKDEAGTMELLARQRELIFPMVEKFGGEVIKEIGDGLMMMFTGASKAVRFAMAVQNRLEEEDLTIRAGIHIGDVIFEEGDVFGSAVNIAARIEPLAPAGGICISEDVRSQIRNQTDIPTVFVGKKELKGVKDTIDIYGVVLYEGQHYPNSVPFFKDLWQRKVIQISGIYLAIALLIRLSMAYFVKEYMLSPHLTSLVWYILLSLLPSIVLIAYYHGRKDTSKWSKVEMIGLPVNIIAAVLILVFVFQGKDLGAITTKLTVENVDGEKVEKVILKNEFRKKIFIFNLENLSGDTTLNYLQYGQPIMLEYDLSQDLFLTPESAIKSYWKMVDAGYETAVGLPVTLMKRLAEQRHMNYFMFGEFTKEGDEYIFKVKVYDTKLTRQIREITLRNQNVFDLTDQLSVEVKKAIGLPDSHISGTIDLPVSEIYTGSIDALYYFTMAGKEALMSHRAENIRFLKLAIEEDPDFALAYVTIAISLFNMNNFDAANEALETAMDDRLRYKLPERQQFLVKYIYYVLSKQPDKALTIVKMWADLCPDDLQAHATLAQRYTMRTMYPEAIDEYKMMLRIDPEQFDILNTIGDYYLQLRNFDSSLVYYKKYKEMFPRQAKSYRKLGSYYKMMGNMDTARVNYEKALLMADESENISVMMDLASILWRTGEFDLAEKQCSDALQKAKNTSDSAKVYNAFEKLYLIKGQAKKSLEAYENKLLKYERILAPKDWLVFRTFTIESYLHAAEFDQAFAVLEEISSKLDSSLRNIVPFGYLFIYAETGETEKATEMISGAEELVNSFGEEMLLANIYYAQGKINEVLGEYELAIDYYKKYLEIDPTTFSFYTFLSRCYRELNEYSSAEEQILISLNHNPFDPSANYEAALLYLETGEEEKGMEHLQRAVDIWEDADADYKKANIAKEKLNSLKNM